MKTILVILVLVTHSLGIASNSQQKQAGTSPCESSTGTQTEANACARYKYKQADSGMNQVYEQLMTELSGFGSDGKTQHKLKQAQSIWLQYRSANCESEASIYEGGSIGPAVYYSCLSFDDGGKDEEDERISGSNKTIGSAAVFEMRKEGPLCRIGGMAPFTDQPGRSYLCYP